MDCLLKSNIKFFPGFHLQRSTTKLDLMKQFFPGYPCIVKKQFWKTGKKRFTFYAVGTILQKAFVKWKCKNMYGIVYPLNSTKYVPKEKFKKISSKGTVYLQIKNRFHRSRGYMGFFNSKDKSYKCE